MAAGEAVAAEILGSTLSVGPKRVPLPQAGDSAWTLLSEQKVDLPSPVSASAVALDSTVAGVADNRTFRYLVVVRANRVPAAGGFGLAGACRRTDPHSARVVTRDGSAVAICTFVSHVLSAASADADTGWAAALRAAERSGRPLPETWLMVGVQVADADDLLDVRYYFNPESLGVTGSAPTSDAPPSGWLGAARSKLPDLRDAAGPLNDPRWLASGWSAEGAAAAPPRAAVIAELTAWAENVYPLVYTGFKGRPVEGPGPPGAWVHGPPIVAAVGIGELPGEVALWKTLSWRAVVSYAFIGSLGAAGGITVVGGFVNAAVYYLHERAWETFGWTRGPGDLITQLPPAGIDR